MSLEALDSSVLGETVGLETDPVPLSALDVESFASESTVVDGFSLSGLTAEADVALSFGAVESVFLVEFFVESLFLLEIGASDIGLEAVDFPVSEQPNKERVRTDNKSSFFFFIYICNTDKNNQVEIEKRF